MKQVSQTLLAMLHNDSQFYMTDLFDIELLDGTILRYTSADIDIWVDGLQYKAASISRGSIKETVGIEVDELDIEIQCDLDTFLPNGMRVSNASRSGVFDGAMLTLRRLFLPQWTNTSTSEFTLLRFEGSLKIEDIGTTSVTFKVKSLTSLLNIELPRNKYQSDCPNTLYDHACKLSKAAWTVSGSINSGNRSALATSITHPTDYFTQGTMTFTSGPNAGVQRSIRKQTNGQLVLFYPLPNQPTSGNTFTISAGCDRTKETCKNKFNNLANFRGCPFVPQPEVLL